MPRILLKVLSQSFFTQNTNIKSYLLLILLALFMLGANPFKSETIAPMDLLLKYPAWQNTNVSVPYIHGERSDVLDAKLPIWISTKRTLYKGQLPLWNHQRAGKPGLIFTNSLLTPAFLMFAIVKDDALGFYLSNLINVLIGLFGMYLFLRLFLDEYSSAFGAFIFMFSGFNSAWFFWAHFNTAIWAPWVFFAVYKYVSTLDKRLLPLVTLSMLMLNLGGFPMVAVMTYMGIAIMVLLFLFKKQLTFKNRFRMIINLLIFSILSVLIAIPFIYPLIELLSWMGGIGYRHGGTGFKLHDFELFINPNLYNSPRVETTFYVGILPLLLLLPSLFFMVKKPKFLIIFGLSLFLYSITIAFTLISPEIIHKIPTLNTSLLTRFGYLIGFSLAVISAYALHEIIHTFKHRKWVIILVIVIFTIQILDQRNLFQRFNGSVPNNSFYPPTNTISHVQKNLKPFQFVLSDHGFLISGTLGGYGLNDWFAHSFHTDAERDILSKIVNKPFKTPTSAMFPFSAVDLTNPYLDYLNIKFLLSTHFSKYDYISLWDNERGQVPAPVMPSNKLIQRFNLDKSINTNGIAMLMATYGQEFASSDVELTLMKDNKIFLTSIVDKKLISDNAWVTFKFKELLTLDPGNYSVTLTMLDLKNVKPLTVWTNSGETMYKLLVNGKEKNNSLKMAFAQDKKVDPKFKLLNLEPNIYTFDNQNVSGGAYFIKTLSTDQAISHSNVQTILHSTSKIELNYTSSDEGWIILPMRSYPGWITTVNGKTIELEKFLDMLPAIKVNGESKIIIRYNPSYNTYTYLAALISLLLLIFSIIIFRKKGTL